MTKVKYWHFEQWWQFNFLYLRLACASSREKLIKKNNLLF